MAKQFLNKPNEKAVLITGCSSGIGRSAAIYLAQMGFVVFATVRRPEDAEELKQVGNRNIIPICPFDLKKTEQLPDLIGAVEAGLTGRGLDGLFAVVHNAGGGSIAPVELMEIEKFRAELETRLVGPVALTQRVLPLLRRGRGRILWIATPALLPIRFVANIHVPDFAVNCLARTLDLELAAWKIPNILIRCGGVKTAAVTKSVRELEDALTCWPTDRSTLYKASIRKTMNELADFDRRRAEPERIAKVIGRALSDSHPKNRYQVGYMSKMAAFLEYLPQVWADAVLARQ